ncbi:hypothetical protein OV079_52560 [Nannocystis pusilla]|uniref:Uncharacterized protein n=1 Tax=Nannocystis pusilla TaxID=889268 RepID=A0A9X3F3V8_9BACT|nr:hypothetical protein [Nannocystis pusilla]MCY1014019.1 hypothetical protein [Nannocystis pusilla]
MIAERGQASSHPEQYHWSSPNTSLHGASMAVASIASSLASNSSVSQASAHGGSGGRSGGCGCVGSPVVGSPVVAAAVVLPVVECEVEVVLAADSSIAALAVTLVGRRRTVVEAAPSLVEAALARGRSLRSAARQQRDRGEPTQSLQANPPIRHEHMSVTLKSP